MPRIVGSSSGRSNPNRDIVERVNALEHPKMLLRILATRAMNVSKSSSRILSLDALRGLAVFLMIEQHLGVWLWSPEPGTGRADYPLLVGFNALGGMAAPLFVSLAGVGSALFAAHARPGTDKTLVTRGLLLMGFGLALNALTPSWFSAGTWFVLHMMGFAMAFAPVWRRLGNPALLVGCAIVLALTPFVQTWLDTPIRLHNERMRDFSRPGGPLRLGLAEGQFPILPWLTFYLAGFVSGRWLREGRPGKIASLGVVFLLVGGLGHLAYRFGALPMSKTMAFRAFGLQLGFFPASIAIATLLLGGALLLIAAVVQIEQKRSLSPNNPWVTLGRISLTLLLFHVPVFRDLTRPIDVWQSLSAGTTLFVIFGFFGVALLFSRWWQRYDYRYGAEWALRRPLVGALTVLAIVALRVSLEPSWLSP